MHTYRVESILIHAPAADAFSFIANPAKLPEWTRAFESVNGGKAVMVTPSGSVEVGLRVAASEVWGTIDWHMTFPDRTVASAYSRVIPQPNGESIYSFVLLAPPAPLEELEGALEQQAHILREELIKLSAILRKGRD